MSAIEKEINKLVPIYITTCLSEYGNSNKSCNYLYDIVQKKIFNPKLDNYHLKAFGILPRKIPGLLATLFFRIKQKKYKPIYLPDSSLDFGIVDLGPALNTRGVQIKFYDFTKMEVLCVGLNDNAAQARTKNEADIYSHYNSLCIPKLIKRISPSIYIRELLEGKQVKQSNWGLFEDIIDALIQIYQAESIQNKQYYNYLDELKLKVKDDICAKSLNILNTITLKEDIKIILTRVHGDFAAKNIIKSKNRLYLIDWERSSIKSIFYDIGNFIFKYSSTDINTFEYMLWKDKTMNCFIKKIELEFDIPISDKRLGLYALFLFERLAFEKELYQNNVQRYRNFFKIWNNHINRVLQL